MEIVSEYIHDLQAAICCNLDANQDGVHNGNCTSTTCNAQGVVRLEFGSQLLIDLDFYCVPKNADFCETV
jgi:hypothetical protein